MARPDPPRPAPPGREWFVGDTGLRWRMPSRYKRCRASGPGHVDCRRPPVADLHRTVFTRKSGYHNTWWAYCELHLYGGGWIEDGRVVRWLLREVDSTG